MFERELEYFIANQEQLVKTYPGKILAIKDEQILGVYDTNLEAYFEMQKEHALGTFMLQPCTPGPEAYTVTISSLNFFNA